MARNQIAKSDKTGAYEGVVALVFSNGKTLSMNLAELPDRIVTRLASHGLEQKTRDAGAGCPVDEAFVEASEVWTALVADRWGVERVAGEPKVGKLVLALTRLAASVGKAFDRVAFDALPKETVAAYRASAAVQAEFAKMQTESAAAAPVADVSSLFV